MSRSDLKIFRLRRALFTKIHNRFLHLMGAGPFYGPTCDSRHGVSPCHRMIKSIPTIREHDVVGDLRAAFTAAVVRVSRGCDASISISAFVNGSPRPRRSPKFHTIFGTLIVDHAPRHFEAEYTDNIRIGANSFPQSRAQDRKPS